ncbi:prepilin-type N-terminal cleavage/methylation domain-containing protein [Caldicellulosiruptoraceae bacterium PP1]
MIKIKKNSSSNGFTLVEMVVVIAIIAIIMAISTPQILKALRSAQKKADYANAKLIAYAFYQWSYENGQELNSVITDNDWHMIDSDNVTGFTNFNLGQFITGGLPKPKFNKNYSFYYKIDTDGVFKIYAGDETNKYLLYPDGDLNNYK